MPLTITLPYCPPSQNELLRMNRWKRQKTLRKIANDIFYTIVLIHHDCLNWVLLKPERRRVNILIRSGNMDDPKNLDARSKLILDALKRPQGRSQIGLSLIWDDSEKWCECEVRQIVDRKNKKTEIILEEI